MIFVPWREFTPARLADAVEAAHGRGFSRDRPARPLWSMGDCAAAHLALYKRIRGGRAEQVSRD
ncbi:MAG: hypothetical protein M1531_03055 [Chloroflexi bacterium]|nr:hypothetical protein [Chloroflexota bacterium]